jgi:hypothetical protein
MENKPLRNFLIGVGSTIVLFFLLPLLYSLIIYVLIEIVGFEFFYHHSIDKYIVGIILFLLSGLFLDQAIMNKCIILAIFYIAFTSTWVNLLILS